MTVAELITRLQELPPDMPVWTRDECGDDVLVEDSGKAFPYPTVDWTEGSSGRGVYL